ncbi:MAG: RNA polymerase sigma factor [Bacillota bacterium]
MDEPTLIARSQQGDQEAFAHLVRRFDPLVRSLAARYVGARDAADAAQEIWPAVYRKLWQQSTRSAPQRPSSPGTSGPRSRAWPRRGGSGTGMRMKMRTKRRTRAEEGAASGLLDGALAA